MATITKLFLHMGVLTLCLHFCYGQGNVARPVFPPVFQLEVQGVFKFAKKEMEGSLYYDSINNRIATHFTYQGVTTRSIYRLDDDELLQIRGTDCTVTDIQPDSSQKFFPFFGERNQNKYLAKPDELFFFTNSTFDREDSNFPSYIYKGKLSSPPYIGSNCEVTHIFTKPEVRETVWDAKNSQPTLATINITCVNNDGSIVNTQYDFFRFKSGIIDSNVFLPPPGIFCNVRNKSKFPGLPAYFSFSYDLTDEEKRRVRNSGGLTVHKKMWYDTKMNFLRMDEFDAEGLLLSSEVFDITASAAYASIPSSSDCMTGFMNSAVMPLQEILKLPKAFFQGEVTLSKAVYVGTRSIHGLDYEVWSLSSDNREKSTKTVDEFYFTKSAPGTEISETFKLSHTDIYTYHMNKETMKPGAQEFTTLPVNNFVNRLRWEAFDVSSCFKKEQKREFKLKVDGPSTRKYSKTFQELLNQLYLNLINATNISATRLNNLACVYDGVKIVEFTGRILDKPNIAGASVRNSELNLNEAYRMIQYQAETGKLSLKLKKDGQVTEYKITAIEEIKHGEEEEDKNLYSGGVVAGAVFGCMTLGMILGVVTCYRCATLEKRRIQKDMRVVTTDPEN